MKFLNKNLGRISEKVRDGKQVSEKKYGCKSYFQQNKNRKKHLKAGTVVIGGH